MAFYHQNNLICHRCTIYFEVYVRNHVCNNNSQSNPELKDGDISVINEINHQLCQNLIENFIRKVDISRATRDVHSKDIIYCE